MSASDIAKSANDEFVTRPSELPTLGRFQIQSVLGQGGFGKVYLAYDPTLERQVAIKVPQERLEFLLREARIAAKLKHPAIVQIYEIWPNPGSSPSADKQDSQVYLVMQYIEGMSLAKKLEMGKVSREFAIDLLLTVAGAIEYAHSQGVLHRDLKPHNILLDAGERPYVVDFGLAVHQQTMAAHVGEGAGTPAYMAPEQAEGQTLTPCSDLWSLGVILYEMLTGQRPFGSHPLEVFARVKSEPARLTDLDSTVPLDLEKICLKCLARSPAQRYQSASDLIADLRKLKTNRAIGPSEQDLQRAERYYKQAFGNMDEGQYPQAVERLHLVVQWNPDFANAYYLLGVCHLLANPKVPVALGHLKKAVELNRDHDAANFLLANAYFELGALPLAALHADQALALKPADQAYRAFQKKLRSKAGPIPAADSVKTADLNFDLEPGKVRQLTDVAETVFFGEKARQLSLTHWTALHYPWRAIRDQPLTGSLLMTLGLFLMMLPMLFYHGWEKAGLIQFATVHLGMWMGLYFPFRIARMLEKAYARLIPVVNMPEEAFQHFYIRQVGYLLGNTCSIKPTEEAGELFGWKQNRTQIIIALTAFPLLFGLHLLCAEQFLDPFTPNKIPFLISGLLEAYVLTWIVPLTLAGLWFVPRFYSLSLRYFLDMPDTLTLAALGTFYIRVGWLASVGYTGFLAQHYAFHAQDSAPLLSAGYIGFTLCAMLAVVVVSQVQLQKLLRSLKARKILEYSYHVEEAFENVMKNPTYPSFEQLRTHQKFMDHLNQMNTRGLTRMDLLHFYLILSWLLGLTALYAYLVGNQIWLV